VPFYHQKYTAAGISRAQLSEFEPEQLPLLPLLTKEELRKYGTSTLCSRRRGKGQFFSSSGTTGTPVQIFYSASFHRQIQAAMEARVRNWAGIHRAMPRGMIGGRRIVPDAGSEPPFYRYNCAEKQVYFSAYHLSAAHAEDYLHGMKRYGVQYMTGYAMSNYLLALLLKSAGLEAPQMEAVITSSECLTSEMRQTISEVYGCKTYDSYSGVENCCLIAETPEGELLASPDMGIMEIHSDSDPLSGELIATGLLNLDQPLIRYQTGDFIRLAGKSPGSGRQMPMIEAIEGRTEDVVTTTDGRQMVRFHQIFTDLALVAQGQVIQWNQRQFEIRLVAMDGFSSAEAAQIRSRMESQVGKDAQIEIRLVDSIPLGANGKFKAVISHLGEPAK
jgi:phenylacetate-CoA ligase